MYYQICRKNSDVLGGTAKRPVWSKHSAMLLKKTGVTSFLVNAIKFHSTEGLKTEDGEFTPFSDMLVVKVKMEYSEPKPLLSVLPSKKEK